MDRPPRVGQMEAGSHTSSGQGKPPPPGTRQNSLENSHFCAPGTFSAGGVYCTPPQNPALPPGGGVESAQREPKVSHLHNRQKGAKHPQGRTSLKRTLPHPPSFDTLQGGTQTCFFVFSIFAKFIFLWFFPQRFSDFLLAIFAEKFLSLGENSTFWPDFPLIRRFFAQILLPDEKHSFKTFLSPLSQKSVHPEELLKEFACRLHFLCFCWGFFLHCIS